MQSGARLAQARAASIVAQMVKRLSATQETKVRSLGWEDPLEKEMATHSSILAWRIPWTEPGPPPGNLPNPGIEPWSPALQVDSLPPEPPGKPGRSFVIRFTVLVGSPCSPRDSQESSPTPQFKSTERMKRWSQSKTTPSCGCDW